MNMYQYIARSQLWFYAHRIGIAPIIKSVFWWIKIQLINGVMEKTVSNETCKFSIYDAHDYKRIDTLGHERHILASVLEEIEASDVFLDVGANIGLYSCFVGSRIDTSDVIAVEAESTNATRLRDNLQRNIDNWSVIECALGDEDGTISFELNDNAGVHRISDRGNHTIKQRRLDSLINAGELPVPDVVKIDVEGAELMVCMSLPRSLDSRYSVGP